MSQYERKEKSQRKHTPFNSGASRAVPPPPVNRPGWKGPSFIKKAHKPPAPSSAPPLAAISNIQPHILPLELQQMILNIFRTTFPISQDPEALKPVLKGIKEALFERDFGRAFSREGQEGEEWKEAYAVRWSPSRVLGYGNLVAWVLQECVGEEWVERFSGEVAEAGRKTTTAVCLGGGAAEVMTFGALVRLLRPQSCGRPSGVEEGLERLGISGEEVEDAILDLQLVDTASWDGVIAKLQTGLMTPPVLSKYASASARASNASFLYPGAMKVTFTQADVFTMDKSTFKPIIGDEPALITLFFTLNELYATSIAKATKFLYELSISCPQNSLLCVIDSPGSYSETAIGKDEEKKYPMHWLMDHALLGTGSKKGKGNEEVKEEEMGGMWEKLVVDESRWYRLEETLKYPVSLENMRFQIHVFKRM